MSARYSLPIATAAEIRSSAADLIKKDRRGFASVLILSVVAMALGLVSPWLLGRIIDVVESGGRIETVDRLALVILVSTVGQLVLGRYAARAGARLGERTSRRVRERFVDRVLALPASVAERASLGDLVARGTGDVGAVSATLQGAGPAMLIALVQIFLILIAVVVTNPLLGICGLLGLAGIAVAARWYLRRAQPAYLAEGAANSVLAETLSATSNGARTVETLRLEQRRIDAGERAIDAGRATRMRTLSLRSRFFPTVDISVVVPVVLVLIIGGPLYANNLLSLGSIVAVALYLRRLEEPLLTVLIWIDQIQIGVASFARVEGVAHPEARHPGAGRSRPDQPEPKNERLVASNVGFAYTEGKDVLHHIDLTIQPGERLALVGPTGAGKTTLGRLLAGIDRPRTGSVTVGGTPVADLSPDQLRRHIVLVTQEQHVFLGTIRQNLQIAAPTATDGDLLAALRSVGVTWTDQLPAGLDTELSHEEGTVLTGAQAQQLALARVVLADPHTLILDEATALLDPTSARQTERSLAGVLKGRTVIAIAHRLQTARDADRIGVIEEGRLVELGSHDELLAEKGIYAHLWQTWRS